MIKNIIITMPNEVRELNVNMSFQEVISGMGFHNGVDAVKILKSVYGISYDKIARVMGLSPATLRGAVKLGTFESYVSEKRVCDGIEDLQLFYLGYTFAEYRREEKKTNKAGA